MPIGDLLAEISGQPSSTTPIVKTASSTGTKRKAEDDTNGAVSTKLVKSRQQDGSYSTSTISRNGRGDTVERSYSTSRPVRQTTKDDASAKPTPLPHRTNPVSTNGRPYQPPNPTTQRGNSATTVSRSAARPSNTSQTKQPSDATDRPRLNQSSGSASKVAPAKPSPTTPTTVDPCKAPKKGSFAEIMARGAKAQETMGKVGMIQHKAIDKPPSKRERENAKSEQKSVMQGRGGKPYLGNARPSSTSKKVKKSATATTGYTGTARPRPGGSSNKSSHSRNDQPSRPGRPGGLLAPPRMSRRDDYYEEDDELDDFIVNDEDDDEQQDPRGGGYYSDVSSDMEAGMSDIDGEERRAELAAREEDRREQALEERLKREKEERRRMFARGR
ncbi:hypothetical protein F4778DRAFT_418748 [Xylariomycetidae sp. FL2044]|nr:hypothetical protein F4778DRAFT_418748 [Xylariomycetidae sp. FL2044]